MRKFSNLTIWLMSVAVVCLCTCGLSWQGGVRLQAVPGTSIKLAVPERQTVAQALDLAAKAVLSLGYEEQAWREESKLYTKDNFEISYDLQDEAQTELNVIYIYFYQLYADLFTDEGFAEYESLVARLISVGLQPLAEDEADRQHSRWVGTPQMFNEREGPAAKAFRQKVLLFEVAILACYSVIVLWSGFSIALKYFDQLSFPYFPKRILFSIGTSLLLSPGVLIIPPLFLLPPFGPFLLVPLPLALLFALFTTTNELFIWAGLSFVIMLFIAFLISFLLRKSNAAVTS
jgi:hypothetical protein